MKNLKKFDTEEERISFTENYRYVSYTEETHNVHVHKKLFFCKLHQLNGDTIEIEGSGELTPEMTSEYSNTTVIVEIGGLCTSISDETFYNYAALTSVTIPNSVSGIGNYVFSGCDELTSIKVDLNNTVYDSRDNCNAIIETSTNTLIAGCNNSFIPNSVIIIGEGAFMRCTHLTYIEIPESVTSIDNTAFFGCTGLTSFIIPNNVTSIDDNVFDGCSGLTNVTIGSGVTSIGQYAFNNCIRLTSITPLAMTAPSIQNTTFRNIATGGILYAPIGSSGYNVWLQSSSYYLGYYGWIA